MKNELGEEKLSNKHNGVNVEEHNSVQTARPDAKTDC